jgi:hypothetical protein
MRPPFYYPHHRTRYRLPAQFTFLQSVVESGTAHLWVALEEDEWFRFFGK